jgi:hypothetical protein
MPTREGLNMEQSFSDSILLPKRKPTGGYWQDERIQKRQDETFFLWKSDKTI